MNETSSQSRGRERKNLKPLFQFLCAFPTTTHTFAGPSGKSLLIVFHHPAAQNLSLFCPALISRRILAMMGRQRTTPDPGFDRPIFMACTQYTEREKERLCFDRFFC
jgi:hypothetical protein